MTPTAVILLIVSAAMHAGWNLIGKRNHPTAAFFLAANAIGALLLSPALIVYWPRLAGVPAAVWALLALTGVFMAGYYVALAAAYRAGHMSVAYPLARSSPVVLVAVITLALGIGKPLTLRCLEGMALVIAGCFLLPMRRLGELRLSNYLNLSCLFALGAGVGTAGYSIIDSEALARLRSASGAAMSPAVSSLLYLLLEAASSTFFLCLFVLTRAAGRDDLRRVLRASKRQAALTGAGIHLTYALVLISMAFVVNVSYVVAFRQLSIPIGAILGMTLLREPRPAPKIIGVAAIFAGLVLVAAG